ncbi:LysM peptidoglycan-binding domain-containing protein [Variovorax sp. J22P240]|uniref:CIS tube protein n=1 Tax=Variovorax sp. J22P240 TaxID=3053514 RepID=UPI002577EFD5|nr:LysM peptidoglycan-binding domain-containing protein [Variovorax sp. J22P240]MDM0001815.1 LysM peptidoglycan-binding domain-containing protein [Variovorax sp. J22P240]
MPEQDPGRAHLVELDEDLNRDLDGGKVVAVQFNPESLKLSFANQIQNNATSNTGGTAAGKGGAPDQSSGTQGRQFIGAGTTKLSVQLWFDATQGGAGSGRVDDVRRLTQQVIYFIKGKPSRNDKSKFLPPGVRFTWGSFNFKGLIDGIEETIEFFSPEGKPLRATISMSLSQQTILISDFGSASPIAGRPRAPGTTPMTPAAAGSTLQGLAAGAVGVGVDWQGIATANGIDNPRQLVPGQLLNLSVSASAPRIRF